LTVSELAEVYCDGVTRPGQAPARLVYEKKSAAEDPRDFASRVEMQDFPSFATNPVETVRPIRFAPPVARMAYPLGERVEISIAHFSLFIAFIELLLLRYRYFVAGGRGECGGQLASVRRGKLEDLENGYTPLKELGPVTHYPGLWLRLRPLAFRMSASAGQHQPT